MQEAAKREDGASAQALAAPSLGLAWLARALRPKLLPNHYAPLHGLRVLAIVLVVQLHATSVLNDLGVIPWSTMNLWFGMDLFFFLSGFLIGSMLLAEAQSGERVDMLRFYMRRSFRIVPPYFIVLTGLVLVIPVSPVQRDNLWLEYLYLTNYIPARWQLPVMPWAWSLAVEEHFYLVVPLLVVALRRLRSQRGQLLLLAALWLSALGVRGWTFASTGPWNLASMAAVFYFQSHLRYDILVAGIFTAYVQRYHADALVRSFSRGVTRHLMAGLSALALVLLLGMPWIVQRVPAYPLLCWGTLTSLLYAPVVLLLLNRDSALSRLLSRRVFLYIATFGYGIYLIHVPVIAMFVLPLAAAITARLELSPPLIWAFVVTTTLGAGTWAGYLVHLLIEKPALVLRDRFSP